MDLIENPQVYDPPMVKLALTKTTTLSQAGDGTVRVIGSQVTLDAIARAFSGYPPKTGSAETAMSYSFSSTDSTRQVLRLRMLATLPLSMDGLGRKARPSSSASRDPTRPGTHSRKAYGTTASERPMAFLRLEEARHCQDLL